MLLLVEEEGRNRKKEEGLGVVTTLQGHIIVIVLLELGLRERMYIHSAHCVLPMPHTNAFTFLLSKFILSTQFLRESML